MRTKLDWFAGSILVLVIITSMWTTMLVYANHTVASALAEDKARTRERDGKITAAIVKSNPSAAIKDFGGDFPAFLVKESERYKIDFRLVMAIIEKESIWDPRAVGAAGEIGLMQMLPGTGAFVAKRTSTDFVFPTRNSRGYTNLGTLGDPRTSVQLGLAYLAWKMEEYGQNAVAIRAYNRSPGSATKHWARDRYAEDIGLTFIRVVHEVPK